LVVLNTCTVTSHADDDARRPSGASIVKIRRANLVTAGTPSAAGGTGSAARRAVGWQFAQGLIPDIVREAAPRWVPRRNPRRRHLRTSRFLRRLCMTPVINET
jgi:hypothetical protein